MAVETDPPGELRRARAEAAEVRVREQLVGAILRDLRGSGIAPVVLRNYEGLPAEVGSDLDLLIHPSHRQEAEHVVTAAARDCGFRLHNRVEGPHVMLYFMHEQTCSQLHVDLFGDFMWRGLVMLTAEEVLERRRPGILFDTPHPLDEALINLLAGVLYQGGVRERYRRAIAEALSGDRELAVRRLGHVFGAPAATAIVRRVASEDWVGVAAGAATLRRRLALRRLRRSPAGVLASVWRHEIVRVVHRARRPPGLCIALIGPDGSGKSTVARAVSARLSGTWRQDSVRHVHWKPHLFGAEPEAGAPVTAPHGTSVRSRGASLLFFVYHGAGFILGGLRRLTVARLRGRLVVLDRYYYDFFVDQRRFRLDVPLRFVERGFSVVPKPDLVFCLDAPPDTVQRRKSEVPHDETVRQREAFRALAGRLPNGRVIDASRPVDEVATDVAREILLHMVDRTARRGAKP